MDAKTKSIMMGAAILLVLVVILGSIFYLGKISRNQDNNQEKAALDSLSRLQTNTNNNNNNNNNSNPTSRSSGEGVLGNLKLYPGEGFVIRYPDTWGLLTCSNSRHLEFDPTNNQNIENVVCDRATKPVTVLVVNKLNCQGEAVTMGNAQVVRSKTSTDTGTNYRWCVSVGGKNLDITHRVSSIGSRASSKDDFSAKIEELISNIQLSQGS